MTTTFISLHSNWHKLSTGRLLPKYLEKVVKMSKEVVITLLTSAIFDKTQYFL